MQHDCVKIKQASFYCFCEGQAGSNVAEQRREVASDAGRAAFVEGGSGGPRAGGKPSASGSGEKPAPNSGCGQRSSRGGPSRARFALLAAAALRVLRGWRNP